MNNGALNKNPEDEKSMSSAMRFIVRAIGMNLEVCIPAQVMQYDRKANLANIKPMIVVTKRSPSGGDVLRTPREIIPNVPVLSLGAGGFNISFPIKNGDLGWLYACDRDISIFLQNLREAPAGLEGPSHLFTDSIFIPDAFRNYLINEEDSSAMVIQSTDSATRISIRDTNIKITTPTTVILDTPTVQVTGNLQVAGSLVVEQTAELPAATTVGGKGVTGHNHDNQVPGF